MFCLIPRVGVTIQWSGNLPQLLVTCPTHTCELLLHVWGTIVPCHLIFRMASEYRCDDVGIEAWRVDVTWWLSPGCLTRKWLYLNPQPVLIAHSSTLLLLQSLPKGLEERGSHWGWGEGRRDDSVRSIPPGLAKASRSQETLAAAMISPRTLILSPSSWVVVGIDTESQASQTSPHPRVDFQLDAVWSLWKLCIGNQFWIN